ncbi:hypothetical protein GCM10025860_14520 [Methanobacterium ferruginis]|nr:hypothetical protein GCM10025860_14520 [Methanobacterium ferruginis]
MFTKNFPEAVLQAVTVIVTVQEIVIVEDLTYNGTGSKDENSGGILGTLQDFFDGITSFFQQLWTSVFGG